MCEPVFDPEQAEAEFWAMALAVALGLMAADVIAHPFGTGELADEGKTYLHTVPGTQMAWGAAWCAGHEWRDRNRALWWVHHLGHRARLLRNQRSRHLVAYVQGKPAGE